MNPEQWSDLESWGSKIAAVTAIVGAVYAAYRVVKNAFVKVLNIANRVQYISEQFETNGGTSLRDALNRIEARQVQTEQRERAFLHTHPNAMCELDSDLRLIWANSTFLDTIDVDTDAIVGYGWHNIVCEVDRERVIEQLTSARDAVRNAATHANLILNADPARLTGCNITATVMRNSDQQASGFLVTVNFTKNPFKYYHF